MNKVSIFLQVVLGLLMGVWIEMDILYMNHIFQYASASPGMHTIEVSLVEKNKETVAPWVKNSAWKDERDDSFD